MTACFSKCLNNTLLVTLQAQAVLRQQDRKKPTKENEREHDRMTETDGFKSFSDLDTRLEMGTKALPGHAVSRIKATRGETLMMATLDDGWDCVRILVISKRKKEKKEKPK